MGVNILLKGGENRKDKKSRESTFCPWSRGGSTEIKRKEIEVEKKDIRHTYNPGNLSRTNSFGVSAGGSG
jgi:hypothetical protein